MLSGEEEQQSMLPSLGAFTFLHLNGINWLWVSFPISLLSPLLLTISPTPTAAARREKESHKNFTSHPTLVNVKEISLPSYKPDKIEVSEIKSLPHKLKLPSFHIFFPPNIRTIVTYMM